MVKHSFKISKPLKVQEPLLNKTLVDLSDLLSSKAAKVETVVSVTEITKPVNEESPIKKSTNKEVIYAFAEAL